jgi:hypothetical protein
MYTKSDLFRGGQGTLSVVQDDPPHTPELNLFTPVGNCAITGAWGIIEQIVELLSSSSREPGVGSVVSDPIGQKDSRADAWNTFDLTARSTTEIERHTWGITNGCVLD